LVVTDRKRLFLSKESAYRDDTEHYGIFALLDKYYETHKHPMYDKTFDNFSSDIVSECFENAKTCKSEDLGEMIRYFEQIANAVRIRYDDDDDELNIELNLENKVTPEQKKQLQDLWCDISNNNDFTELYIDIVKPETKKFHWENDSIVNSFAAFEEFETEKKDFYFGGKDCKSEISNVIQAFTDLQHGININNRFKHESSIDPIGRTPEQLKQSFDDSVKLFRFRKLIPKK